MRATAAKRSANESLKAYDDFLQRYPNGIAGQQERAEAAKPADAHKANAAVTATASKTQPAKEVAPDKKPSLWQRLFHRNNKKGG